MTLTKDLVAGLVFILIGLVAVVEAQGHPMGSLLRMGPGYYPTLVGGLTILVGAALAVKGALAGGPRVPQFAWRELALLIGSIVVAAFALERLGLVAATFLLVVISRYASRPFHWRSTLLLAAALSLVGAVIFWWFLKLPIKLWPESWI
ncbi:tripartite tricarboxylate transporter TctB family protein [Afifella sp. IM 167]|uniref:tripartite tricarboxylate transporter TctB family protein n=1 Tax=Afifella sp. IM 167 TaxID=2033586 RepID=UPI001CCC74C1|nr:tripartite tricarboxylate transporter TctB family protein [Afifella sp. IM 167]MBZ8132401.1 hypothetical protein [Afifella sp. IM 167]